MRAILQVDNLHKQYRLGERRAAYSTIREEVMTAARRPVEWLMGRRRPPVEYLAALRGVSFEVRPGEVVGIVGRNGAGKSTLLKILSRITEPSHGRVELYGRVGSLLEVGTGFHPELTGRENIYLNGAILGMRKFEIDRQFDQIVAFAEVERFLETPVKRYSSGMYTKLAFSVAAHLDPEILLVDEVLAVGDAAFQKKCMGKMREVAGGGRTVLFVSHNAAAIEALCDRCLWLRDGRLEGDGEPVEMLRRYLIADSQPEQAHVSLLDHAGRTPGSERIMQSATLLSQWRSPATSIRMSESLAVQVRFKRATPLKPVLGLCFKTVTGAILFSVNNRFIQADEMPESAVEGMVTCWVDRPPLMPGTYFIDLHFGDEYRDLDVVREAMSFDVEAADIFGTGQLCPPAGGPICWGARYEYEANDELAALAGNGVCAGRRD
jgi:lipopolysaccharide transport system ATP-binding protein